MRPPEVFVRELTPDEGERLRSVSQAGEVPVQAPAGDDPAGVVYGHVGAGDRPAGAHRRVARAQGDPRVQREGFGRWTLTIGAGARGRRRPRERDRVVSIARARPDTRGVPLTRWSLVEAAPRISPARGSMPRRRRCARSSTAPGLSHQRIRSWKWSPDPDFAAKAQRVLSLYRERPKGGRVVCFDEMGPIQLIPNQGSGWAPEKLPERLRGSHKPKGGALPLRRLRRPRRPPDRAPAPAQGPGRGGPLPGHDPDALRPRAAPLHGDGQPLLLLDAEGPRTGRKVERRAHPHAHLRQLPNRIECHFWAIQEFVVKNADYDSWDELAIAMVRHISYRNGPHRNRRLAELERRRRVA